jgi:hypothetical protein
MIGVIASDSDQPIVLEFFELFKTPWEWVRPGQEYDVVLCASLPRPTNRARLFVIYGAEGQASDVTLGLRAGTPRAAVALRSPAGPIPLLGAGATLTGTAHLGVVDDGTGEAMAVLVGAEAGDTVRVGYDLFCEVRRLLTGGQAAGQAGIPSLDRHIALLRHFIVAAGIPVVEIPPVPAQHPFSVCLTHDIDHPVFRNHILDDTMLGFFFRGTVRTLIDALRGRASLTVVLRNWGAVLAAPFVHLRLLPDPWRAALLSYGALERGLASTFFAIPYARRPGAAKPGEAGQSASAPRRRGAGYDVSEIAGELGKLAAGGAEIALHGIDAWREVDAGRVENARLATLTGLPGGGGGVRMHWLYYDPESSPGVLDRAGFAYDSTCGYNETVGYRAGTAQVFRPPGATRLLELPLQLMDTAMFYPPYCNFTGRQARAVVREMIRHVTASGGVLTVNWHDRSVAPERCWDGFYRWLLAELRAAGARFVTAREAVSWFARRREIRFTSMRRTDREVTVRTSLDAADEELAGRYRLRVHGCRGTAFVDVPLRSGEMAVAV